ncbi:MAG TPA: zinc-dependent metalloprotease [Actinomycetota bacterium]|nr:zinc-dependent metalloprotease [Actinomycetota bacterium]
MTAAADRLVDWPLAARVGRRVAGAGPKLDPAERAAVTEDFSELVPRAGALVSEFTNLAPGPERPRAWVMTRGEWIDQNLRGFRRVIDPFAGRVMKRDDGRLAGFRRAALGAQLGLLLGYLSRRVLGQYDLFLPPEDQGLLYFVAPNVVGVERRYRFPARDFRTWVALHEVSHQVQFGGVPWLRGHISGLVDDYFESMHLDPRELIDALRRAVREVRSGDAEWRGIGFLVLLMTPEQRQTFRRMQAVMSLLEGHGNFVMDTLAHRERVGDVARMKRTLRERRRATPGLEKAFQKAIGFEAKSRQYDVGERFVAEVVERVGMEGFNRVWEDAGNLPTLEEVGRPERWVHRVGAS